MAEIKMMQNYGVMCLITKYLDSVDQCFVQK